jgi:acetyl-CoA carboxylase biotin carboxyl carrier protein
MEQTIKSPVPGTFYRRPSPEAEPYVNEGDRVKAGDVVGLVELMKSFHDVKSESEGVVGRFLVENEDLVEAGQDLIVLDG